jgi:DNA-directed RNA polymerase subunit RPC12/RpoP
MVESGLASRRRDEKREVVCPECGTINPVIFQELGGTITLFCKKCGEKIHLVFDRTMMDMELKGPNQQEAYARA